MRAPGQGLHKAPLFVWAMLSQSVIIILCIPVLAGEASKQRQPYSLHSWQRATSTAQLAYVEAREASTTMNGASVNAGQASNLPSHSPERVSAPAYVWAALGL
jgi:hypothetical protein